MESESAGNGSGSNHEDDLVSESTTDERPINVSPDEQDRSSDVSSVIVLDEETMSSIQSAHSEKEIWISGKDRFYQGESMQEFANVQSPTFPQLCVGCAREEVDSCLGFIYYEV